MGSPVSCLDPNTNSWSFAGVISEGSLGCVENTEDTYIGLDMRHQLNFFWAQAVADTRKHFLNLFIPLTVYLYYSDNHPLIENSSLFKLGANIVNH